jgi:hypothetical protein
MSEYKKHELEFKSMRWEAKNRKSTETITGLHAKNTTNKEMKEIKKTGSTE